jgi:hypothetical protein
MEVHYTLVLYILGLSTKFSLFTTDVNYNAEVMYSSIIATIKESYWESWVQKRPVKKTV